MRADIEAATKAIAWLAELQIHCAVIMMESQSMLHKINRGLFCMV